MNNRKWLVIGICAVLIIAIAVAWALLSRPGEEAKEPEVTAAPEVTAEPEAAKPDEAEPAAEGDGSGENDVNETTAAAAPAEKPATVAAKPAPAAPKPAAATAPAAKPATAPVTTPAPTTAPARVASTPSPSAAPATKPAPVAAPAPAPAPAAAPVVVAPVEVQQPAVTTGWIPNSGMVNPNSTEVYDQVNPTFHCRCEYCCYEFDYHTSDLGHRSWYPHGFVYCPRCQKPLRHKIEYEILTNVQPAMSQQTEIPASPQA